MEPGEISPEQQDRLLAAIILESTHNLIVRWKWRKSSACLDADPQLFVLESGSNSSEGKKYCDRCTVRQECYDFAVRNKNMGLWGGVMFTVNSVPPGPAAAPVEVQPLIRFQNGIQVSAVDDATLELFG